ncbi:hypothetical protein Q5692_28675 [Microcoleus sp. C2C3]|uniref:hypothetical protein n=1 Tax=unclassified Microcoleus TaxID=2642155 RepID=UPI002FD54F40
MCRNRIFDEKPGFLETPGFLNPVFNNAWRVQREAVASIVSPNAPDLIGKQEEKARITRCDRL